MPAISDILARLEKRAPASTAEDWDNVGLLVGDASWKTSGAVVSVDLTPAAIAEAVRKKYRLIVTHHPCVFPKNRGLARVTATSPAAPVHEAIRQGIAVYASHTNFDRCALEVPKLVAAGLGAKIRGRLHDRSRLLKLVVFVPKTHAEAVRAAIAEAGAGHVGDYDSCSFAAEGEGSFRGGDQTKPFIGKPGRLQKARELRLETIVPEGLEGQVVSAMLAAHPYEEVAYDLIAVEQAPSPKGLVRGSGYGFWGEYAAPRPLAEVLRQAAELFAQDRFWLTDFAGLTGRPSTRGLSKQTVSRVGFVAGKGASFVEAARQVGCDLFITGEAGYHGVLDGARKGIAVLELGHRESERFYLQAMEEWLRAAGLRTVVLNLPVQVILDRRDEWIGDRRS